MRTFFRNQINSPVCVSKVASGGRISALPGFWRSSRQFPGSDGSLPGKRDDAPPNSSQGGLAMFSRGSRSLTPGLCCASGAARPSGSGAKTPPVCRPSNRALLNHGKGAVMRRWVIGLLLMGVLGGLWPEKAPAIERGLPEYGNGAQNFFAGVVPPPGFYTSYNLVNYQANKFAGLPGILVLSFRGGEQRLQLRLCR